MGIGRGGAGQKSYPGNTHVSGPLRSKAMERAWRRVWTYPGENGSQPSSQELLLPTCGLGGKCIFKMWHPFQQHFEGHSTYENLEWAEHEANGAFGWSTQRPGSKHKRGLLNGAPLCVCPSAMGCRVLNSSSEPCSSNLLLSKKPPQKVESENHCVVYFSLLSISRGDRAHWGSFVCCSQPVATLAFLGGVLAHVVGV